jgi:hypothetical protein
VYSLDESDDDHLLLCMQDVGDTTRPTSLEPGSRSVMRRRISSSSRSRPTKLARRSLMKPL